MYKLQLANGKIFDACEALHNEIESVTNKLIFTQEKMHWYSIAKRMDARAFKKQIRQLRKTKEHVIGISNKLVAHIQYLDVPVEDVFEQYALNQ